MDNGVSTSRRNLLKGLVCAPIIGKLMPWEIARLTETSHSSPLTAVSALRVINTLLLSHRELVGYSPNLDELVAWPYAQKVLNSRRVRDKIGNKAFYEKLDLSTSEVVPGWKASSHGSPDGRSWLAVMMEFEDPSWSRSGRFIFASDESGIIRFGQSDVLHKLPTEYAPQKDVFPNLVPVKSSDVLPVSARMRLVAQRFAFATMVGVPPDGTPCVGQGSCGCDCGSRGSCYCTNCGADGCGWCCPGGGANISDCNSTSCNDNIGYQYCACAPPE